MPGAFFVRTARQLLLVRNEDRQGRNPDHWFGFVPPRPPERERPADF